MPSPITVTKGYQAECRACGWVGRVKKFLDAHRDGDEHHCDEMESWNNTKREVAREIARRIRELYKGPTSSHIAMFVDEDYGDRSELGPNGGL